MKLIKCKVAKGNNTYFECPHCSTHLEDEEETSKRKEQVVFLCPVCHRFFENNKVIPFEVADEMFPDETEFIY